MGEQNFITTVAAYLAEAVRRQGRVDEALELAAEAAAGAADDDVPTQVAWRSTRAKALIGDDAQPTRPFGWRQRPCVLASGTDDVSMQGDALLDQAEVHAWLGDDRGGHRDDRGGAGALSREAAPGRRGAGAGGPGRAHGGAALTIVSRSR